VREHLGEKYLENLLKLEPYGVAVLTQAG
jgi:hypothetical protein